MYHRHGNGSGKYESKHFYQLFKKKIPTNLVVGLGWLIEEFSQRENQSLNFFTWDGTLGPLAY